MSEYKEFWVSFINVKESYINVHRKKPLHTEDSEFRKVVHVIEKQAYTDLQEKYDLLKYDRDGYSGIFKDIEKAYYALETKANKLVAALEFIRDNPNYGKYHDGSSEFKAKEALKEWRKT